MLKTTSITLQGKDGRQPIQFVRGDRGVVVRIPAVEMAVGLIKVNSLWSDTLDLVLPLLYGDPGPDGKYDCTDGDIRRLAKEIDSLF